MWIVSLNSRRYLYETTSCSKCYIYRQADRYCAINARVAFMRDRNNEPL